MPKNFLLKTVLSAVFVLLMEWEVQHADLKFDVYSFGLLLFAFLPWLFDGSRDYIAQWLLKHPVDELTVSPTGFEAKFKRLEETTKETNMKVVETFDRLLEPRKITKISVCDDFWKSIARVRKLYILGINGHSFLEEVERRKIVVDEVQIIAPSDGAIDEFYADFAGVNNAKDATEYLKRSIARIDVAITELIDKGLLAGPAIPIRRLRCFPVSLYCIADRKNLLMGTYRVDPVRKLSIGLRSAVWAEFDPAIVGHFARNFEELWDVIGE